MSKYNKLGYGEMGIKKEERAGNSNDGTRRMEVQCRIGRRHTTHGENQETRHASIH